MQTQLLPLPSAEELLQMTDEDRFYIMDAYLSPPECVSYATNMISQSVTSSIDNKLYDANITSIISAYAEEDPVTIMDRRGFVSRQYRRVNGKYNGEFLQFHPNGQLQVRCFYYNGQLEGTYQEWDSYGRPLRLECFSNGVKKGVQMWPDNCNGETVIAVCVV